MCTPSAKVEGSGMAIAARSADASVTPGRIRRSADRGQLHSLPTGMRAAWIAGLLGLAYAAVSVYWGLGGTWLLATIGGSLERAGRQGGVMISLALWAAAALKVCAAVIPLLAVSRRPDAAWQRTVVALAWVESVILILYGSVLTGVGLLIQAGVVRTGAGANRRALAWHAFLWDPWFLVWGLFVLVALVLARRCRSVSPPPRRRIG